MICNRDVLSFKKKKIKYVSIFSCVAMLGLCPSLHNEAKLNVFLFINHDIAKTRNTKKLKDQSQTNISSSYNQYQIQRGEFFYFLERAFYLKTDGGLQHGKIQQKNNVKALAKQNPTKAQRILKKYILLFSKQEHSTSPKKIGSSNTNLSYDRGKGKRHPRSTLKTDQRPFTCRQQPSGLKRGSTPKT